MYVYCCYLSGFSVVLSAVEKKKIGRETSSNDFQITSQHIRSLIRTHKQQLTLQTQLFFAIDIFPIAVICGQIDYTRSQQQQQQK